MKPYVRTAERRAGLAIAIHRWKPWTRSTGPRTPEGIERIRQLRNLGCVRPKGQALARELRALTKRLDDLRDP